MGAKREGQSGVASTEGGGNRSPGARDKTRDSETPRRRASARDTEPGHDKARAKTTTANGRGREARSVPL
eukprot:8365926-Pyramimonas_sp.AAC.1